MDLKWRLITSGASEKEVCTQHRLAKSREPSCVTIINFTGLRQASHRYAALFGALFSFLLLFKVHIFGVTIVTGYYDRFIWKFNDGESMEWLASKGLAKRDPGSRQKEIKDAEQLNESTGPQNSTE